MRRSFSLNEGKTVGSVGWGWYGPYLAVSHRIAHRTYAKASIGLRGPVVGGRYNGSQGTVKLSYNLLTRAPSLGFRPKLVKIRDRR